MGIFDSLRDAVRPDDDSPQEKVPGQSKGHSEGHSEGHADGPEGQAEGPKHVDEAATDDVDADLNEHERPAGGKHARRD
jgi:hypothetical protein